ncbi:MAG: DUF1156 domain-containing protein [Gemmatimonadaceae bacterium]|jgi:hypothetical protein|nr:DUF1156 domain-containing protein [Gemmatimonadaceae bacterium]
MGTFLNPFQAGQHRPSARVAPAGGGASGPPPAEIAAAAGRPATAPASVDEARRPTSPMYASPPQPLVAVPSRRASMKLLETALISAADAVPGVIPAATEARVRAVLAAPPSSAVLAVAFASLVDDPSVHPERFATPAHQQRERERLFGLMERLARPGARLDDALLREARAEIRQACLRPVPPDTADAETLFREAQGFREQDELGGEDAIDALFADRRAEYERTGRWRGTLLELRACFWYWWLWEERLGGGPSTAPADRAAVLALYRQVRAQWDELSEEVERALEWFRAPRLSGSVRLSTALPAMR